VFLASTDSSGRWRKQDRVVYDANSNVLSAPIRQSGTYAMLLDFKTASSTSTSTSSGTGMVIPFAVLAGVFGLGLLAAIIIGTAVAITIIRRRRKLTAMSQQLAAHRMEHIDVYNTAYQQYFLSTSQGSMPHHSLNKA
jgi:hypothetical protein